MLFCGSNIIIVAPYKKETSDNIPIFVGNNIKIKNKTIEIQFITNAKKSSLEFIKVLNPQISTVIVDFIISLIYLYFSRYLIKINISTIYSVIVV